MRRRSTSQHRPRHGMDEGLAPSRDPTWCCAVPASAPWPRSWRCCPGDTGSHWPGEETVRVLWPWQPATSKKDAEPPTPNWCCSPPGGDLQDYAAYDPAGRDLQPLVDLVDTHGADVILAAVAHLAPEDQAEVAVSTAHKAKGREWAQVKIADDFTPPCDGPPDDSGRGYGPPDRRQGCLSGLCGSHPHSAPPRHRRPALDRRASARSIGRSPAAAVIHRTGSGRRCLCPGGAHGGAAVRTAMIGAVRY